MVKNNRLNNKAWDRCISLAKITLMARNDGAEITDTLIKMMAQDFYNLYHIAACPGEYDYINTARAIEEAL